MPLDLKQALAERHRKEGLSTAPEGLLWIFANLKNEKARSTRDIQKGEGAKEFARTLWRQSSIQFGSLNAAVFRQWNLPSANALANAMRDLAAIGAITLDNENEIIEYTALGEWEELMPPEKETTE